MKKIVIFFLLVSTSAHLYASIKINHKSFPSNSIFPPHKNSNFSNKPLISAIPVPQLGTAGNFALFTVAGAVGNTGISTITGNIGTNVGAVSGFTTSIVNGATYVNNSVTAQCVADLTAVAAQITAIIPTAVHGPILGGGETLFSGVYSMPGAGSASGVLTLDAQGDPNAEFIFQIGGAFTTGAGATVLLVNGASANNVYWIAGGAISMATLTNMSGTMIANIGAISMGAGGTLTGRMLSATGAVSTYGDTIISPVDGFIWIGAVSTNWNTGANWRGGTVPAINDDSFVGVNLAFTYFPAVPASSDSVYIGSIAFGNMGGQASGVIVNAGSWLNVQKAITYQSDAGSGLGYSCTLSGMGAVSANNINIISNTSAASSYTAIFASSVNQLNIAANLGLTSSNTGAVLSNATFNLTGGTALVSGLIQTTNTASGTSSFTVSPLTVATLQLFNAAALSGLSPTGANVITFNNTGATVQYTGSAQTVYTDAGITGLASGVSYQNLSVTGCGIERALPGNLNISGDFTNGMANDSTDYFKVFGATLNFNGTTQNLMGGTGNGSLFFNTTFSGAGTKSLTSGKFAIAAKGTLTMIGNNPLTVLNSGGILTLLSNSSSSATVSAIPAGPGITGNVNVQRYITGGTGYRGYRLASSPVYAAAVGSNNVYSINYLQNSMDLTGNAGGGFDKTGNPTIYLYREDITPSKADFTSGNFWGITAINNFPAYTYSVTGATATTANNIPAGNGFMFFFRGNRAAASLAAETTTSYTIPVTATATAAGMLNQGQITVSDWYTPTSANLGYTGTGTGTNFTVRGLNLVGNPYASSIDWETYNTTSTTTGIYANNVGTTIYELNPLTNNFDTYQKGGIYTNHGKATVASGQGFFVLVNSAASPQLIFNESAKTAAQNTGLDLFMAAREDIPALTNATTDQHLRLQMAMDSVNTDDIYIGFNAGASVKFVNDEDAPYKGGQGKVKLASFSGDSVRLAINKMPLPGLKPATIPLFATAEAYGTYSLDLTEIAAIPQLYDIWLMDSFNKDSLDMRHNPAYRFDITTDTASYGSNRFQLLIRQNPALMVHLLKFTGSKSTNGAQLVWATENEQNYTRFTIERSTNNGQTFEVLGGSGSNGQGAYSFLDKNPLMAADQYRLVLADLNGTISYSGVVTLMYAGLSNDLTKNIISIYPNPAVNTINLSIGIATISKSGAQPASYAITIISGTNGSIVKTAVSSSATSQHNVSSLMPGSYVVQVVNNNDKTVVGESKFVKL